ncbi:MAG: transposase [Planctomycetota bacterium]|nr:transposase [Planctomycetota bacterium]
MKPDARPLQSQQPDPPPVPLLTFINPEHHLVKLADSVDWVAFAEKFGPLYSPQAGAPAIPIRLILGLTYIKHLYKDPDETILSLWRENPYWQYFCGSLVYDYQEPLDPAILSDWRKSVVEAGLENFLKESLAAGLKNKTLSPPLLPDQ